MDDLSTIGTAIDEILSKQPWTDKEINLFILLKAKVDQYQKNVMSYEHEDDKKDIIANIREQSWYQKSKSKAVINGFLNEMIIANYQIIELDNKIEMELVVEFPKSKFKLVMIYNLNDIRAYIEGQYYRLKYVLYIEDYNSIKRNYLANHDTTENKITNNMKLPQIHDLYSIMKIGAAAQKSDLLKMFAEIVLFYDETTMLSMTPINTDGSNLSLMSFLSH